MTALMVAAITVAYVTLMGLYVYFALIRFPKVYPFVTKILDAIYEQNLLAIINETKDGISYDKAPSFTKLLYSFKPLQYKRWLDNDTYEQLLPFLTTKK